MTDKELDSWDMLAKLNLKNNLAMMTRHTGTDYHKYDQEHIIALISTVREQREWLKKKDAALKFYADAQLLLMPKSSEPNDIRSRQLQEENGITAKEALAIGNGSNEQMSEAGE